MRRNLIFIRHGQTEWNKLEKINSSVDTILSLEGKNQIQQIAEGIKDQSIDEIISSPMNRAIQTANILNMNFGVNVKIDSRIKELDFGKFEGYTMKFDGNQELLKEFHKWHNEDNAETPDTVESFESCIFRAQAFLTDMINSSSKNTIIVTHGVFLRILLMTCVFKHKAIFYKKLKIDNGGICIIEIETNNTLRLVGLNLRSLR